VRGRTVDPSGLSFSFFNKRIACDVFIMNLAALIERVNISGPPWAQTNPEPFF
jgi:hypothetical protein